MIKSMKKRLNKAKGFLINLLYGKKICEIWETAGYHVEKDVNKRVFSKGKDNRLMYKTDGMKITPTIYLYYSPERHKLYYSRDYAPLGKVVQKSLYEYVGEL